MLLLLSHLPSHPGPGMIFSLQAVSYFTGNYICKTEHREACNHQLSHLEILLVLLSLAFNLEGKLFSVLFILGNFQTLQYPEVFIGGILHDIY